MDERDWLILKVLYEKKNITKAAQSLYISQPTLTKKIQQIEKEFEVAIITRGAKGVHFTPQGEYLVKCANEMLSRLCEMKETVQNMSQEVGGTLRLAVSNYMTRHKLPGLLKLFREQFPNVNYKVTTGWSHEVYHLVYNQDVHIGIVRGDYHWADAKQLLFEETICIASKEKIDLEDLPSLPRIQYETDMTLKTLIDNWWTGTFSSPPFIGMEVDKADTCKEMVLNGLGYGILPSVLVENHPDLHCIHLENDKGLPLIRKTWMLYHKESLEMKVVKEFVDYVKKLDLKLDI
ncbi:LysR family transcriptional regulator [Metabacillus halosaccharovorans]|uniref:LysR family transcriptional regulator n=1 Tax=Metabacillus halosaccharovorans TaxID=930124 RepID=UPI00203EA093|nr:LysR family transcriptional regulator [Metabacillus halosaccharovorans]MCM3442182.1 LysR family transcriptional regulator [Metabacillus halosaccharovorans]